MWGDVGRCGEVGGELLHVPQVHESGEVVQPRRPQVGVQAALEGERLVVLVCQEHKDGMHTARADGAAWIRERAAATHG